MPPIEINGAGEGVNGPIREALLAAQKARTLSFPSSEPPPGSNELPNVLGRSGMLLGFGDDGDPVAIDPASLGGEGGGGGGLPAGGIAGQVLAKASDVNGDAHWVDPPEGGESPQIATQQEAEDGVNNAKMMTPLRVKQALNKALQGSPGEPATYRGTFSDERTPFGTMVFEEVDPSWLPPTGTPVDPAYPVFRAPVDTLPGGWEGSPIEFYWITRFQYGAQWNIDYSTAAAPFTRENFGAPKMGGETPDGAYGTDFAVAVETPAVPPVPPSGGTEPVSYMISIPGTYGWAEALHFEEGAIAELPESSRPSELDKIYKCEPGPSVWEPETVWTLFLTHATEGWRVLKLEEGEAFAGYVTEEVVRESPVGELASSSWGEPPVEIWVFGNASETEAVAGVDNELRMTPLRTKQAVGAILAERSDIVQANQLVLGNGSSAVEWDVSQGRMAVLVAALTHNLSIVNMPIGVFSLLLRNEADQVFTLPDNAIPDPDLKERIENGPPGEFEGTTVFRFESFGTGVAYVSAVSGFVIPIIAGNSATWNQVTMTPAGSQYESTLVTFLPTATRPPAIMALLGMASIDPSAYNWFEGTIEMSTAGQTEYSPPLTENVYVLSPRIGGVADAEDGMTYIILLTQNGDEMEMIGYSMGGLGSHPLGTATAIVGDGFEFDPPT